MQVISVDPYRCRMWSLHDRLESQVTEESCRAEIDSFSSVGQLVPVLGRVLRGEPDFDVELVYGARRLFVARHINKPLIVEVRELTDREAIVAMDIENRQRVDISPYERGLSYARWLRAGHFQSQDDIARALKISASQVSRLLKFARLPSVVVEAFGTPAEICEGWGLDLAEALGDPQRRPMTVQRARTICKALPRPPARQVYQQLLTAGAPPGRKLKSQTHDEVVTGEKGQPLFRIRQQTNSISVLLPVQSVSARSLENIRCFIAEILLDSNTQAADTKRDSRPSRNSVGPEHDRRRRGFVVPEPGAV